MMNEPSQWNQMVQALKNDRLAHAYLLVGDPRAGGRDFALRLVQALFCGKGAEFAGDACEGCDRVARKIHPDVVWLEPFGKNPTIKVDALENVLSFLSRTSFEGGWKAVVLLQADRLQEQAANKLLKTLEEPPPRTLLLLVSDRPEQVLPTLVSRCQRVNVDREGEVPYAAWRGDLISLLRQGPARDSAGALWQAAAFTALFERVKEEIAAQFKGMVADVAGGDDEEDFSESEGTEADEEDDSPATRRSSRRRKDTGDGDGPPDEPKISKAVFDARVGTATKSAWNAMATTMLQWNRDVMVIKSGADAGLLHHAEEEAALREIADRISWPAVLRRAREDENMARRLAGNLPVATVFSARG
jgi:DNA polymerase III delta' subunit